MQRDASSSPTTIPTTSGSQPKNRASVGLRACRCACISALRISSCASRWFFPAQDECDVQVLDDLALIFRDLPPVHLQAARGQTVSLLRSKPGQTYSEHEAMRKQP